MLVPMLSVAQPQPGDVFREFTYIPQGDMGETADLYFSELDPDCKRDFTKRHTWANNKARMVKKYVDVDLKNVVRAELSIEYWGGHSGTSEQNFSVNENDWLPIPQPKNTPLSPECYYRTLLGNNAVKIPLDWLVQGENNVRFHAGPQKCYDFEFGFYWIYSFTIRVYYDTKLESTAKITGIQKGDVISDSALIKVDINNSNEIKQIDLFGHYMDFNWSGDGEFTQWHYNTFYGDMRFHIGTLKNEPYEMWWDSSWLPDQKNIKIAAKILLENGTFYITDSIDNLTVSRENRSVKMMTPSFVPSRFGARAGEAKSCFLSVPTLYNAKSAKLILSTWSGATDDQTPHQLLLNGKLLADNFAVFHNYSFDELDVPLNLLKEGKNQVTVQSDYLGHAFEVNWPGPVLKIEYIK